jgi:8-oxo-dGTP diphosphatase
LSVEAIIIRGNEILLGKRGGEPFKGYWGFFGGFVEWDEMTEQALLRETKEECGLDITSFRLVGVYSNPERHPRQVVTAAYAVEAEGRPQAGDDISKVCWFSLKALPELPFDHHQILDDYLRTIRIN